MDRRSFLTLLGAVGVLTPNLGWLLDPRQRQQLIPDFKQIEREARLDDTDVSAYLKPRDIGVWGRASVFDFFASHNGGPGDPPGIVQLARFEQDGGGALLNLAMGPGGIVRWVAAPGEEIYGPVRIILPEFVTAYVIGEDRWGRKVCATKDGVMPLSALPT
jgi:hypothetical protein